MSAYDAGGNLISSVDYQGDWAFFRALQAAHLTKQSDLRYTATFRFGSQSARVTLQAANLKNPFLDSETSWNYEAGFRNRYGSQLRYRRFLTVVIHADFIEDRR